MIGVGVGGLVVEQAVGFKAVFAGTPQDKATAVAGMQALAKTFAVILPPPVRVDTVAGFIDWRLFGFLPMSIAVYALIAGASVIRGEEERGLVEDWLAAGVGRVSLVACRVGAFAAVLVLAAALGAAIAVAGTQGSDLSVHAGRVALNVFALMPVPFFFFSLSLLVTQVLPSRRGAASLVAAFAVLTYVVANLSTTIGGLDSLRWLSPFYYYVQGHSLAEGTSWHIGLLLAPVGAGLALSVLTALAFRRRDIGSSLIARKQQAAAHPFAMIPYPRRLIAATTYSLRWTILGWTAGIAALAFMDTAAIKPITDTLGQNELLKQVLSRSAGGNVPFQLGFLNYAVFILAAAATAALAINAISSFSADQEERRVEMILAQPVSVFSLHLARYLALLVAVAVPAAATGLAVLISANVAGVDIAQANLWAASFMIVPLGMAVGSIGAAMLPRFNRLAVGVLALVLVSSLLVIILSSFGNLPDWLVNLSLLKAYGSPAASGIDTGGLMFLLGVTAAGLVATLLQARAEVRTG